ncbi:NAD-P-binding protein [Hymenopellis radicata]|nr:NAD-P-binding protein [Hymenopellis radicata]
MGVTSIFKQQFPADTKYTADDVPDLSGKVVLITGGNCGIGFETAKALLKRNAKVYIACRDEKKAGDAIARLSTECDGKVALFHPLNLSNLSAIKASAESFLTKEPELHILFNNAGVMEPPKEQLTDDGYDQTLGVNLLGPFYFTTLILPALLVGASSSPEKSARIVNTSSLASELASKIDYDAFKDGPRRKKLGLEALYNQSKFGITVFSNELARRYGDKGVISTAVNPGTIQTELQRTLTGVKKKILVYPVEYGALTQLYAGTSPEGKDFNGKYLGPWARLFPGNPVAQCEKTGSELWEFLEKETVNVV